MFVVVDLLRPGPDVTSIEAVVLVPALMIVFASLAAMVGVHFSLQYKKTVQAVMAATTAVFLGAGLLTGCGFALTNSQAPLAAALLPFTPYPAMQALADYQSLFGTTGQPSSGDLTQVRVVRFVSALISGAAYSVAAFSVYNNLVRNFDMTVRRQSA
jgi:hypothetical protein